ncbi:MAG: hypothetical protein Q9P14_13585 [candidate division KSB1 bacterium]|nr:hypothetical protein [candidate division KSB1 bacterium]
MATTVSNTGASNALQPASRNRFPRRSASQPPATEPTTMAPPVTRNTTATSAIV